MTKIIWKRTQQGGYRGFIGEIQLFSITYDSWSQRLHPLPWILRSTLPGLENWREESEMETTLMIKAATALDEWLKKIGG